ncbi:MAG: GNAT family N-acetyltransferase [Candidatus Wallbacteria bacterium]|nr:GNAT family N-acetyltransferase [Candidatus Wallbacteria bacterium]
MELEVRIIREASREEIFQLYVEENWWKPEERIQMHLIDDVIKKSFCFAGAFCDGKMIGMGRAISDGISDAYIQDVMVTKSFRGRGLGMMIMECIISHLKSHGVSWIGLIANPGTSNFYKGLGFKVMEKFTPMLLESPDE